VISTEWLATTGLTVFVAAGTGALVWLIMHLHLQLAVLREREAHWHASLPPPTAETQPALTEHWIDAQLAHLLFQLAEQRHPAFPALAEVNSSFAPEPAALEVEVTSATNHRRRVKPSKPAPKRANRSVPKAC
jgi:hypothetical protein